MSYNEYRDMFDKAQKDGIYHMFIFDIINSKSYGKEINNIEKISRQIIYNVYYRLGKLEEETNKKILRHHLLNNLKIRNEIPLFYDPFQLGDLFGLTIIRNSIYKEIVYKIFDEEKTKLQIYWDFHMIDGYYETDNYAEGNQKYYRGYCIPQLEELSKLQTKKR